MNNSRTGIDRTLSEFARGMEAYELAVPHFNQTLWFVPNEAFAYRLVAEGVGRGRIWTADELQELADGPRVSRPDLENVVRLKAAFGAEIVAVKPDPHARSCHGCGSHRFWISVHGVSVCSVCHPPAAQELVASWADDE